MASLPKGILRRRIVTENWKNSNVNTDKVTFLWPIPKFADTVLKSRKFIKSKFYMNDRNKSQWSLIIDGNRNDKVYSDYVSLYLTLENTDSDEKVGVISEFYIIGKSGDKVNYMKFSTEFHKGTRWGNPKFIEKKFLIDKPETILPKDTLTVFSEISITTEYTKPNQTLCYKPSTDLSSEKFSRFFNNSLFSDVTFNVNGKKIFAHRIILYANAFKFFNDYCSEAKEHNQNTVNVEGIPYAVMEKVLRFIYYGEMPEKTKEAFEILPVAEKHDLQQLKIKCKELLSGKQ